jgi:O-methyltransferase
VSRRAPLLEMYNQEFRADGTEIMVNKVKSTCRLLIRRFGIDVVRYKADRPVERHYPPDFSDVTIRLCNAVKPYTMTTPERISALIESVRYIVANKIDGAMVECGVWKGGSTMAMMLTLMSLGETDREVYLYDTFSGMSTPTEHDVSFQGEKAQQQLDGLPDDALGWCRSSLEEVKRNILGTGFDQNKVHFIEGKVEDTIPAHLPRRIALLRLDTDWYESTKHELTHLFPLLEPNGVLIIDDYGHWQGAREAVDEYIEEHKICILLNRIDYTGRIAVKR